MIINDALRLIRIYHNLNLSEAAERLGLSKSYLSEIENHHKKVSLDVLEKYAECFSMPLSSIMFFAEHQSNSDVIQNSPRTYIASKTIKMLDWIATITSQTEDDEDDPPKPVSSKSVSTL